MNPKKELLWGLWVYARYEARKASKGRRLSEFKFRVEV